MELEIHNKTFSFHIKTNKFRITIRILLSTLTVNLMKSEYLKFSYINSNMELIHNRKILHRRTV